MISIFGFGGLTGCGDSAAGPAPGEPRFAATVIRVSPSGGETGVPPTADVRIEFDRPMAAGAEEGCRLHAGGIDGPAVAGSWTWSDEHRVLTFTPGAPMAAGMEHTLHLGGGLRDAEGRPVDLGENAPDWGGRHVDDEMPGHGSGGGHMMGDGSHSGGWWQDSDGGLGWLLSFRTGT